MLQDLIICIESAYKLVSMYLILFRSHPHDINLPLTSHTVSVPSVLPKHIIKECVTMFKSPNKCNSLFKHEKTVYVSI